MLFRSCPPPAPWPLSSTAPAPPPGLSLLLPPPLPLASLSHCPRPSPWPLSPTAPPAATQECEDGLKTLYRAFECRLDEAQVRRALLYPPPQNLSLTQIDVDEAQVRRAFSNALSPLLSSLYSSFNPTHPTHPPFLFLH